MQAWDINGNVGVFRDGYDDFISLCVNGGQRSVFGTKLWDGRYLQQIAQENHQ